MLRNLMRSRVSTYLRIRRACIVKLCSPGSWKESRSWSGLFSNYRISELTMRKSLPLICCFIWFSIGICFSQSISDPLSQAQILKAPRIVPTHRWPTAPNAVVGKVKQAVVTKEATIRPLPYALPP